MNLGLTEGIGAQACGLEREDRSYLYALTRLPLSIYLSELSLEASVGRGVRLIWIVTHVATTAASIAGVSAPQLLKQWPATPMVRTESTREQVMLCRTLFRFRRDGHG
jgi:hypothetical protein